MSERFWSLALMVAAVAFFAVGMAKSEIRGDGATTVVWLVAACFLLLLAIYARIP